MFNPQVQLDYHVMRFAKWGRGAFPGSDKGLRPILKDLLEFKDFAPVWSCEGHPGNHVWDTFYIMFVCNAKGFKVLHSIQQRIIDKFLAIETSTDLERQEHFHVARSIRLTITRRQQSELSLTSMPVVILDVGRSSSWEKYKEVLLKIIDDCIQDELTGQ